MQRDNAAARQATESSPAAMPRRQALGLYNAWRVVQAAFLLVLLLTAGFFQSEPELAGAWSWGLAAGYLAFALAMAAWQRARLWYGRTPVLSAFLIDVVAIVALTHTLAASGPGTHLLLVIVVVAATVLLTGRLAIFIAAFSSVVLLADYLILELSAQPERLSATEVGLLGAVFFAVALVGNYLARLAADSATLAEQRGADLANMGVVNELVVTHLQSGVLLLDGEDRIRLCNLPGHTALGGRVRAGERLRERCLPLQRLLEAWRSGGATDRTPRSLVAGAPPVLPRFVVVGGAEDATQGRGATLVFLDDTSELSRQAERMTINSMGKLGASVAHEIRNPLGAISHAAQLLSESEGLEAADRRLIEIIQSHSRRVNELVENVLSLSRRRTANPEPVDLPVLLEKFSHQWLEDHPNQDVAISIDASEATWPQVLVDRSHLEQILNALAENALAHGRCEDGRCQLQLRLRLGNDARRVSLQVVDTGPGVPVELRSEIFQPFFSTSHSGSGLGLYIVHALCAANQIEVGYRDENGEHFFELLMRAG